MDYYSALKKKEIMPLTTHGAPRDHHTKLSQSEREGQIHATCYHLYVESKI